MKTTKTLAALIALALGNSCWAAVSAEEAKQLGTTLTLFGAEKAGNKDGSIPEYTGGLPADTSPPGFVKGSGRYVNPFPNDKPLFSITAQNMDKYADKLSEGSKELLKRYPTYRIDVYPSRRVVNFPKEYLDKTVRNATSVPSITSAEAPLQGAGGLPFPIPKNGYELLWNVNTRYHGTPTESIAHGYYIDASGRVLKSGTQFVAYQQLYNARGMTPEELKKKGNYYAQNNVVYKYPGRVNGDVLLLMDDINATRRSWSYSASTRRVRLSPDVAYDYPIASMGGVSVYDEASLFFGKMDRFEFKLVGKKEMYIPYNNYDLWWGKPEKVLGPKHMNPDLTRWELHRTWVVEAKLKPEFRHIYSKFTVYYDEDMSGAGVRDSWDQSGKLYKAVYDVGHWFYDTQQVPYSGFWVYDLSSGAYGMASFPFDDGYFKPRDTLWPGVIFTPDGMTQRSKQ